MSDDLNRKQPRSFEPPPWERAQFEELARERAERQAESELDEALADLTAPKTEPPLAEVTPEAVPAPTPRHEVPADAGRPVGSEKDGGELDEKAVAAMFVQLRMEEPEHDQSLWRVGLVFSAVAGLLGSILMVWGIAALIRTGTTAAGMIGGSILIAFGGLFVGIGVWMAVRSLKERGVL